MMTSVLSSLVFISPAFPLCNDVLYIINAITYESQIYLLVYAYLLLNDVSSVDAFIPMKGTAYIANLQIFLISAMSLSCCFIIFSVYLKWVFFNELLSNTLLNKFLEFLICIVLYSMCPFAIFIYVKSSNFASSITLASCCTVTSISRPT